MVASPNGELYQRVELLYFSEEYKIFLITGQPLAEGGRKAYVAAKAFGEFDKGTLAALKEAAKPVGDDAALSISRGQGQLVIYDRLTRTDTFIPNTALDADVQKYWPAKATPSGTNSPMPRRSRWPSAPRQVP